MNYQGENFDEFMLLFLDNVEENAKIFGSYNHRYDPETRFNWLKSCLIRGKKKLGIVV